MSLDIEPRPFVKIAAVGPAVALSCSATGKLVAVNDPEGRVQLFGLAPEPTRLPLELSCDEARAVLLHPDGRQVIALIPGPQPSLRIIDPWTGAVLRELELGVALDGDFDPERSRDDEDEDDEDDEDEDDEDDEDDDDASASLAASQAVRASILDHAPHLSWWMPLEIVNRRTGRSVEWFHGRTDDKWSLLISPDHISRLALHPDARWLAVLDRSTFVVDLETGALVRSFGHGLDLYGLFEYGEGTHTIDFDEQGRLAIASTAISGNPYIEIERFDVESGQLESTTEVWRQSWPASASEPEHQLNIYEPTSFLPPARIPVDHYKVVARRAGIELWSSAGLVRSFPLGERACLVPSFDAGSFCRAPRALIIEEGELGWLDLVSAERTPCQIPASGGGLLRTWDLGWIAFAPARLHQPGRAEDRHLTVWERNRVLWAATFGSTRWSACALPEGRSARACVLATGSHDELLAFVVDDAGDLWMGSFDAEPSGGLEPAEPIQSLAPLEAELEADPHAVEPFLIYADALSQRGDPRGELIMLHHHGAHAEAAELIRRHARELTGGLAPLPVESVELEWRLGFVRAARFRVSNREQLGQVLCFLGTTSARLLESLTIELAEPIGAKDGEKLSASLDAYLAAARRWPLLKGFVASRG